MGSQSALFGPVKYSVLPAWFAHDDLLEANAWVEFGTFLAILLGSLAAGVLLSFSGQAIALVCVCIVVLALLGWWQSRKIAPLGNHNPEAVRLGFKARSTQIACNCPAAAAANATDAAGAGPIAAKPHGCARRGGTRYHHEGFARARAARGDT